MRAAFSIETPARAAGAIGIVRLSGDDLDNSLGHLGLGRVAVGAVVLADILGVDRGLVVRWSASVVDLMVHGGPGVIEAVVGALGRLGVAAAEASPRDAWPEAKSEIEARMLAALAVAPSPRAVPVLLAQPARHARSGAPAGPGSAERGFADAGTLGRLLHPPLVLISGAPNIGKSSLLNALARRDAAIVADMPGTTRDAVAVTAVLDGLAVRLLDAPGFDAGETDAIIRAATTIASRLEAAADLVLCCADSAHAPPTTTRPSLTVATKADLGGSDVHARADVAVSAATGAGLEELAVLIRRSLVPDEALGDERPWCWWASANG